MVLPLLQLFPFSPLFFSSRLGKHLCPSFIRNRTRLFFCADCSLVTSDHSTMSCHTDQWPIKQGTWKGRTFGWQKTDMFFPSDHRDKHWTSFQSLTEHLSTTCVNYNIQLQHSWTQLSIQFTVTSYWAVKSELKVKDWLLNRRNNGALTLLASLWSCNATVLC